ncbi:hypothetical protein Taro_019524 [Colocasia esculenta]|uniref:Uncharacterized protein n=1 Tax=Colocasia esculenta TaxID=4460 RepID=A0A843UZF8_COLES|nr:hypothetical protein [Colocasia esculenta]
MAVPKIGRDSLSQEFVAEQSWWRFVARCIASSVSCERRDSLSQEFVAGQSWWQFVAPCVASSTKLQDVKITQPSSSSSSSIATADDIYSQVFGKDRPGRVRGVGTCLAPTSLWGTSSQCQAQLRAENAHLNAMVKELAERLGKVESIVVESKQVESTPNMERCVQSSASIIEAKGKESLMLGKKVKLCDMEGHPLANAIIMSLDKSKMVMGKSLGEEHYEVAILFAYKPNAPLFVKDNE